MAYQPKSYKKFVATAATATLVATAVVPAAFADEVKTAAFTDVAPQYKAAVDFVIEQAIAKGVSETQFGISQEIIRGDAAIMVANAAKINDETAPASGFTDVPTRGALAINSLKDAGVTNGKSATQFDFYGDITRGEAAIFLANAFDLTGDTSNVEFTDVNSRYLAAVAALVDNNVTNGKSATQFGTDENITRGDFARWLLALESQIVGGDATASVLKAEETLLEADLEAAIKLVALLPTSDAKTLLEARLTALENLLEDLLEAINNTDSQLDLYNTLNDAKIKNVLADYADEYSDAFDAEGAGFEFASLADVQEFINDVNAEIAVDALTALEANADASAANFDLEVFYEEVANVEKAIAAVDAAYPGSTRGTLLAEQLQEILDELVESVEDYVNYVAAVVDADTEIKLYNALQAGFKNVVAANVDEYAETLTPEDDTVAEIQFVVDYVNADEAIAAFGAVDADTTQAEINALTALVKRISDQDAGVVKALYAQIAQLQNALDAIVDAETAYAATVAKAELALDAYVAAGGSVNDDVYYNLDQSIANEASIEVLTIDLEAIEDATEELIAYDEAVEAAEAALAAYVAAGGEVTDAVYTLVEDALESEVRADIEATTYDLEVATAELEIVIAINSATTATELQAALAELELTTYDNLTLVQRIEVANRLLEVVAEGNFDTYAKVSDELDLEVDAAVAVYLDDLALVNTSTTIVEVDTELERLDLANYNDLSASAQLVVSENVLNNIPTDANGNVTGYTSLSQIIAQF